MNQDPVLKQQHVESKVHGVHRMDQFVHQESIDHKPMSELDNNVDVTKLTPETLKGLDAYTLRDILK